MLNVLIFDDKYLIKGNNFEVEPSDFPFIIYNHVEKKEEYIYTTMAKQTQVMPTYWTVKLVD